MKCNDFLPAFAARGMIRRAQAIIHAGRCTRCAAVRDHFLEAKRRWAHPSALTAVHREMWQSVVIAEPLSATSKVALAPKLVFAIAAVVLVIVTAVVLTRRPHLPTVTDVAHDRPVTDALKLSPLQSHDLATFSAVERALDQLAIELKELENQAALTDARNDVEGLLTTYRPLGTSQQYEAY